MFVWAFAKNVETTYTKVVPRLLAHILCNTNRVSRKNYHPTYWCSSEITKTSLDANALESKYVDRLGAANTKYKKTMKICYYLFKCRVNSIYYWYLQHFTRAFGKRVLFGRFCLFHTASVATSLLTYCHLSLGHLLFFSTYFRKIMFN